MKPTVSHPYLPTTDAQRQEMLGSIGADTVQDLFQDIPSRFRSPSLQLPTALSELELRQELEALGSANAVAGEYISFLGGGAYRHFIPAVVRAMVSRGELLTSYTPYQPEVSQGTLQATYDFQTLICLLTGMDVANAGMYDGATALAEAALMSCRVTGRNSVRALATVNPRYLDVVQTYCAPQGITVNVISPDAAVIGPEDSCLLVQYPNFLGGIESMEGLADSVHASGGLLVASVNPLALGLLKPPGDFGVDIVTGECQPLGIPLSFGGPYVGLFTCREEHVRQMPGRVVGRTQDKSGKHGFVLTLQTREQHIRRAHATSNICTSEALIATASAVYLAALGPIGLQQVAALCYHKAHYTASLIERISGYSVILPSHKNWFHEFVIRGPGTPADLNKRLFNRGILGGINVSKLVPNGLLLCVTEMKSRKEIEALAQALAEIALELQ